MMKLKFAIFASKRSITKTFIQERLVPSGGTLSPMPDFLKQFAWWSCWLISVSGFSSPQWITPTKNPLKKWGWYPTQLQSWDGPPEGDLGWWQWIGWPGWPVPTLTNHLACPKSNMEPLWMTIWWQYPPGNLHLPDLGDPSPGASLTGFSARLEARPQKYASFVEMNIHHDDIGKTDTEDDEV